MATDVPIPSRRRSGSATARRPAVYLLRRVAQTASRYDDRPTYYAEAGAESRSGVPERGFAKKSAAEAERKRLERAARESVPVGLYFLSVVPDRLDELVAAAKKLGLPPVDVTAVGEKVLPEQGPGYTTYGPDYSDYFQRAKAVVREWWDANAAAVTPFHNAALWDILFPDHRFFDVVAMHLSDD